jgi:Fe2+ or Zn2+ uptake regulation protein
VKITSSQRHTRQLQVVWEAVAGIRDHPTAEQVFARARRRLRSISRGTVYRNLEKLADQGRLLQLRMPDGILRFDATVEAHDHFICERCGRIMDVPLVETPTAKTLESEGFRVTRRLVTWLGYCPTCQTNNTGTRWRKKWRASAGV